MTYIIVIVSVVSFVCSLTAAYFLYQSSTVQIDPGWNATNPEPVIPELQQMAWTSAILRAASSSARMNKTAAYWAAAVGVLTLVLSVLGMASIWP